MNAKDIAKVVNSNKSVLINTINQIYKLTNDYNTLDQLQEAAYKQTFNEYEWLDDEYNRVTDYEEWYSMNEVDLHRFLEMTREKLIYNSLVIDIIPTISKLNYDESLLRLVSIPLEALKTNLINYFSKELNLDANKISNVSMRNQLVDVITKVVKEME